MKAIGYLESLPIENPQALVDIEVLKPTPTGRELLVEVKAISVNPVDTKVRVRKQATDGNPIILGFDAAGIVKEVGPEVTLFQPGDEVWYAGSIIRQGSNSEFQLVDERIVGPKPKSLSFADAAALPLTSITAWELLFDRFEVPMGKPQDAGAILVIGGAGGVGSILIQLARKLTGLTVVATASRPETREWCLSLGAHHVVDHTKPFGEQLKAIGVPEVNYAACLTGSDQHYPGVVEVLAPQGKVGIIDDPQTLDAKPLKGKSASLHWELMFTRSTFQTKDMIKQHQLLAEVAALVDEGILRTTLGVELGTINAANLREAHAQIESGKAKGKIVLSGF